MSIILWVIYDRSRELRKNAEKEFLGALDFNPISAILQKDSGGIGLRKNAEKGPWTFTPLAFQK